MNSASAYKNKKLKDQSYESKILSKEEDCTTSYSNVSDLQWKTVSIMTCKNFTVALDTASKL